MRAGSWRTSAALAATRLVSDLSRRARLGGGSTIGGRVGLLLAPDLLRTLGAGRRVALVSGTNGKTTTTRLLAEAMRTAGAVATSGAGANLPAGLVAALAAAPSAAVAVLEVDEGYLPVALAALRPEVVVLLNLSRDQLDRVSEVRMVAQRWREALADYAGIVVANVDDPLVAWAAQGAPHVRAVAAGGTWRNDAYHCPACGARLAIGPDGWSCRCTLARPAPDAALVGDALERPGRAALAVTLAIPGRFNQANAVLAAVAADELGVDVASALAAMAAVREVAGRYGTARVGASTARLLLAKNPAGWTELLELVRGGSAPVVVGINARIADGRDPSWLWDVPFELLAGRHVTATGERRRDLAVRLRHAGIDHTVADDALAAIAAAGSEVDYIGNYTAFQDLRRRLARPPAPAPAPRSVPVSVSVPVPGAPAGRGSRPSALRIAVVHPDLLGTYGDGGNGRVLLNRALWRDIPAEILVAPSDAPLPRGADIYLLGGGEDGPQAHSATVLQDGALAAAVDGGAVVLAICAGYQILGRSFPGAGGTPLSGVGLLPVETVLVSAARAVGELLVAPPDGDGGDDDALLLTGFENHAGRTHRDAGVAPLGRVVGGVGNGDGSDGARVGTVFGTYLHGPVLARNPRLADELLGVALGTALAPLDDAEEHALRAERLGAARAALRRPAR